MLNEVSSGTAQAHIQRFVGTTARVLVVGKTTKDGLLQGLTDNYLEVQFAGSHSLQREICYVHITSASSRAIMGELTSMAGSFRQVRLMPVRQG